MLFLLSEPIAMFLISSAPVPSIMIGWGTVTTLMCLVNSYRGLAMCAIYAIPVPYSHSFGAVLVSSLGWLKEGCSPAWRITFPCGTLASFKQNGLPSSIRQRLFARHSAAFSHMESNILMGKGLVGMGILQCADPTFLVRQAFMGGNGLYVHAFLCPHLHLLTSPLTVLRGGLKCARNSSRPQWYTYFVTATIVVSCLSYFFIHDVSASFFLKCFC
jgi:hypothetical protein